MSSPIVVTGSANVFEAALNVELTVPDGSVIASGYFMATAGTGTWGTYSTSLSYPPGHEGPANLTVYSTSAKDGSRINSVTIGVTLG